MNPIRGDDEAMRTTCPSCSTAYVVPDDRIGPKGRKVRCTRCGEEWHVDRPTEPAMTAAEVDDLFATAAGDDEPEAEFDARTAEPPTVDALATDDAFDEAVTEIETDSPPTPPDEGTPPETVAAAEPVPATPPPAPRPTPRRKAAHHRLGLPRLPPFVHRLAPFGGPTLFLAAALACAGLFVFRTEIVVRVPALAGFYRMVGLEVNLRGIVFGEVKTLRETEDGKPVLVVEGSLANTTAQTRDVPALRFALRDGDAQELYAWSVDPRPSVIAAGDRLRFRTRLVAPPDRAVDLQVRFAERRNRQAGLP